MRMKLKLAVPIAALLLALSVAACSKKTETAATNPPASAASGAPAQPGQDSSPAPSAAGGPATAPANGAAQPATQPAPTARSQARPLRAKQLKSRRQRHLLPAAGDAPNPGRNANRDTNGLFSLDENQQNRRTFFGDVGFRPGGEWRDYCQAGLNRQRDHHRLGSGRTCEGRGEHHAWNLQDSHGRWPESGGQRIHGAD